jgi:RNA polymerase sigma-70 factor (ECF subfamily)
MVAPSRHRTFAHPNAHVGFRPAIYTPPPVAIPYSNLTPESDDAADLRLVEAIRRGDPKGWDALIDRYQDRLFSICLRMVHNRDLAEDLTQDAFVKIIQGLPSFDARAKFSTWAIRVTMNVCLSRLRSEKLRRHASLDASSENETRTSPGRSGLTPEVREPEAPSGVEIHEDRERVLAALRDLDPDQRAMLILSDCHGHSYEQIAEVFGIAVGTVKSRLFRARTALRDAVEKMDRSSTRKA